MTPDEANRIHGALQKMEEKLDAVSSNMGELALSVARWQAASEPCRDRCKKHDETLYGNGKSGLVARVSQHNWALSFLALTTTVAIIAIVKEVFFS